MPADAAGTIDLSDTLVLLTTEFGRTLVGASTGRDHLPEGYASVLLGGPLRGRSVLGRISGRTAPGEPPPGQAWTTGTDVGYVSPTELRAALLYAADIHPTADGAFVDGDFVDSPHWWGAASLTHRFERILGF